MDHKNHLDTNFYKIEYEKEIFDDGGSCTYKTITKPTNKIDIEKYIEKYTSMSGSEIYGMIYGNKILKTKSKDGVYFNAKCEYTGIHYHSINITIVLDGKIVYESSHSAHSDGSLSYPSYDYFLVSKLNYYEYKYPQLDIYIHPQIKSKETFHSNSGPRCEI